jgi:selenocysteine-specific elongation factor
VLGSVFEELLVDRKVLGFAGLWYLPNEFECASAQFLETLKSFHAGLPKVVSHAAERVATEAGLTWSGKPLDRIVGRMAADGHVCRKGSKVRISSFQVELSRRQQEFLERVIQCIMESPVETPNAHQLSLLLPAPLQAIEEIIRLGIEGNQLVEIAPGVFYTPVQIEQIRHRISGLQSAKEIREVLGTGRKYGSAIASYFGITGSDDGPGETQEQ